MTDELLGKTVGGKFRIESVLGEGGFCIVYKAVQLNMNRTVAIKVLRDELRDDVASKRLEREARSISELSHPNLVSIYDTGVLETGQPYNVLEFIEGQTLSSLIDWEGALPAARALPIFIQVCDVLQYAHEQGVINRDLSPMNIMLIEAAGTNDFVKLVDFGVIKFDEERRALSQKLTATGEICGNPMYMSPEQTMGAQTDYRTDIYSFGVVMYETLTGLPLFSGTTLVEIFSHHLHTKAPKPSRVFGGVPAVLDNIVLKALEKDREKRHQSFTELKSELLKALKALETDAHNLPALYAGEMPERNAIDRGINGQESKAEAHKEKRVWVTLSVIISLVLVVVALMVISKFTNLTPS